MSEVKPAGRSRWLFPWVAGFKTSWIPRDVVAGIALGVVMIPQGMAYAELAGVPAVAGLYATMGAIIGYALLGSSRQLVIGPDSSTSTLMAASLLPIIGAGASPEQALGAAAMLAMTAGVFLLLAGFAKAGIIANFISKSVLVGYLNALALTILVKQLPKILGIDVGADATIPAAIEIIQNLGSTQMLSLAVGLGCIVIIFGFQRFMPKIPGSLVAVVAALIASSLLNLADQGVAVVGSVPSGLPSLSFPDVGFSDLGLYLVPALGIALMGFADTTATSQLFADRNKYDVDSNRDLFGLGAASFVSGLFGGLPVSASDSRTAVANNAGGKSQVANLVGVAVIGLVLAFFATLLEPLPSAALGAVVITAGLSLFDIKTFQRLWQESRTDFWTGLVAFVGAILFGLLAGIILAVLLSLWNVLLKSAKTDLVVLARSDVDNAWQNIERMTDGRTVPGATVVRWEAALYFGNSKGFSQQVKQLINASDPPPKWLIFDAEATSDMDFTGATVLDGLLDFLSSRGVTFVVAEPNGKMRESLSIFGLEQRIGTDHIFPSVDTSVTGYLATTKSESDAMKQG